MVTGLVQLCRESSYSKQNVIGSDQMYIKKQAELLKTS